MKLRREQWEEIRNNKRRSEAICKAEKLGEEMGSDIKGTWKETHRRKERWGSPAEENDRNGLESLQEKVGRLARRVEELESDKKKGRDSRQMTGSSSENEGGGGKWDGENWWFRVNHRGPINSKLRRKISRTIKATIDETKRWGDDLFQLRSRVEWLETARAQQRKTWVGDAPGIQARHAEEACGCVVLLS